MEKVGIHGMIIDQRKPKCWEKNLFECHDPMPELSMH
jgi:hypothetical protein